jgi:hypothetical protein
MWSVMRCGHFAICTVQYVSSLHEYLSTSMIVAIYGSKRGVNRKFLLDPFFLATSASTLDYFKFDEDSVLFTLALYCQVLRACTVLYSKNLIHTYQFACTTCAVLYCTEYGYLDKHACLSRYRSMYRYLFPPGFHRIFRFSSNPSKRGLFFASLSSRSSHSRLLILINETAAAALNKKAKQIKNRTKMCWLLIDCVAGIVNLVGYYLCPCTRRAKLVNHRGCGYPQENRNQVVNHSQGLQHLSPMDRCCEENGNVSWQRVSSCSGN